MLPLNPGQEKTSGRFALSRPQNRQLMVNKLLQGAHVGARDRSAAGANGEDPAPGAQHRSTPVW